MPLGYKCKDWWDEQSPFPGFTRSGLLWLMVILAIVASYFAFPIDMDWVFGRR